MFRVSYRVPGSPYGRRNEKEFFAFASALLYFLQKFHEDFPELRLEVLPNESLDDVSDSEEEAPQC